MRFATTSPTTSLRRPCTFSVCGVADFRLAVSAIIVSPAFGLAHVQLKLQLEQLVREILPLMLELGVG
jgi:hypothetical protein